MRNLKDILTDFLTRFVNEQELYSARAEVLEIDTETNTCKVITVVDGSIIEKVNLSAYRGAAFGLFLMPEIGSIVTVTFYNKDEAYIAKSSVLESLNIYFEESNTVSITKDAVTITFVDGSTVEITADTITFNGGTLDGLVTVNELVSQLNTIENDINTLKQVVEQIKRET